jgi:hypothetical protein
MVPHELYGLPLERFTPERDALVKALRSEGRRDEAARVGKLRKPSVAAWAVNQLVGTQRRGVSALFDAGDALRDAQSKLVAGGGNPDALRKASERERLATEALVQKARGLLSSEGRELTQATLEKVSETLHAAALDDDARAQVRDGCLERELRHVGLGTIEARAEAKADAPGARPRSTTKARRRPGAADRERAKRVEAARQSETETRRALDRASRELDTAERRRDRAAESLRAAEAAVGEARRHAKEAAREHDRARNRLKRA